MFNNVEYPYPGRRLKGVVSTPVRGKLFCRHRYNKTGFHEEIVEYRNKEPVRISIRHYKCRKCGRVVFVFGPTDQDNIENTCRKTKRRK